MKFLAVEKEINQIPPGRKEVILAQEAKAVFDMHQRNFLREIYFNEDHCAVLILECENKNEAGRLLAELPLVKEKYIHFHLTELRPYTGFLRIIT